MTDFKPVVCSVIRRPLYRIIEFLQKLNQFFVAAVYITDNIERTVQFRFIVVEFFPHNRCNGIYFIFRFKNVKFYKTFFLQTS